jgi:type VI secretion system protein VasJ
MPAPPAAGEDASDWLFRVGEALVGQARRLREASSASPAAYRLLRVGLWLHLDAAPPGPGGRTSLPALPANLVSNLGLLTRNRNWPMLLEEAESALVQSRFALDLHHHTWVALGELGPTHAPARAVLEAEVRNLLERMPELPSLAFADGTPLAGPAARAWLEQLRARGSAPAAEPERPAAGDREPPPDPAALLGRGRDAEALARLGAHAAARPTGRERFEARLAIARACGRAGLDAVAKAMFEELDRDAQAHALDAWEPRLAAEVLKGLLAAVRALGRDPRAANPDLLAHYRRLCRIDPAAAMEVWP